jgi:flagellar basal-body rod protein FlgG
MIKSLYTAASGMKAQQINVDTISNNLANVNTPGFKRSQPTFQDLIYVTLKSPGLESNNSIAAPSGIQLGSGSKLSSTTKVFSQGVLEETKGPMDIAIEGEGFLAVQMPDGASAYTRDGHLLQDANGRLVTVQGYPVSPSITLGQDVLEVNIGPNGEIAVRSRSNPEQTTQVGTLELVRFVNPAGLEALGGNLFRATEASGTAITGTPGLDGMGTVRQGFIERSNVEVVNELVSLIVAQRAYEVNSRAIRTSDEMLALTNTIVR